MVNINFNFYSVGVIRRFAFYMSLTYIDFKLNMQLKKEDTLQTVTYPLIFS